MLTLSNLCPIATVKLNHLPVKALFDTGSAVTLVSSAYKNKLQLGERLPEIVKLSSANGSPLHSGGTYRVKKPL